MAKVSPVFSEVDADLCAMKWRTDKCGYARRTINKRPNPPISVFAHHEVCIRKFGRKPDYSLGEVCDHINRDRLDNRRENLRIVTRKENSLNSYHKRGCVTLHKKSKRWQVSLLGKYVGLRSTREDAIELLNIAMEVQP